MIREQTLQERSHEGEKEESTEDGEQHSRVVGTLNYMPPERILRQEASQVTDVYSLGVLLYFLTTLQLPFQRRSFRHSRKNIFKERYISPHLRAPERDLPFALVEIINKALARKKEERCCTVQEMIEEIVQFQHHRSSWRFEYSFSPEREEDWLEKRWAPLPISFQSEGGAATDLGYATRMLAPFALDGNFKVECEFYTPGDARGLLFHFDPKAVLHAPSSLERCYLEEKEGSSEEKNAFQTALQSTRFYPSSKASPASSLSPSASIEAIGEQEVIKGPKESFRRAPILKKLRGALLGFLKRALLRKQAPSRNDPLPKSTSPAFTSPVFSPRASRAEVDAARLVRIEERKGASTIGGSSLSDSLGSSLSIPAEASALDRSPSSPFEGIALWISGRKEIPGALIRDGVTILSLPSFALARGHHHRLKIENHDNTLTISYDQYPPVTYVSRVPLVSMPLSLWVLPGHFSRFECRAFGGKLKLEESCLHLPDYLFAKGRYFEAIEHYENIRSAFFDYAQGRKATYRSALAWLEIARQSACYKTDPHQLCERATKEALSSFDALQTTLSAPLRWLGKALVYRQMGEHQDEVRALEMAFLRIEENPLLEKVDEEVIYRLYQSVPHDTKLALQLFLVICRSRSRLLERQEIKMLFKQLFASLEMPYFWYAGIVEAYVEQKHSCALNSKNRRLLELSMGLLCAFYLRSSAGLYALYEGALKERSDPLPPSDLISLWLVALFALHDLGAKEESNLLWNLGTKKLPINPQTRLVAYQIAYPCGTFWLQERFSWSPLEQKLWIGSLRRCLSLHHEQMYQLLAEGLSHLESAHASIPSCCKQHLILAHLYFGEIERALEALRQNYDLIELDLRAFLNALRYEQLGERSLVQLYIDGILSLPHPRKVFVLWAQLIAPSPTRYALGPSLKSSSHNMSLERKKADLQEYLHGALEDDRGRLSLLLTLSRRYLPRLYHPLSEIELVQRLVKGPYVAL